MTADAVVLTRKARARLLERERELADLAALMRSLAAWPKRPSRYCCTSRAAAPRPPPRPASSPHPEDRP
jgi:hypothetical protein